MSICIIGGGVAGTLLCLELLQKGKLPSQITIIDPFFDGGALVRHWGAIYSNTRWQQIVDSMSEYLSAQPALTELSKQYLPDSRVLLKDLGWFIQDILRPFLSDLNILVDKCIKIQKNEIGWEVNTSTGKQSYRTVFLCQGGRQKLLDFGKPIIPLEVALHPAILSSYIRRGQSVAVFGLAHSGTLISKHLMDLGVKVYGVHKSENPFVFDRDGQYDGIKQESAEIADRLLQATPETFEFVHYGDTRKVIKIVAKVHWIVCAVGFEGSPIQIVNEHGQEISSEKYNPETAELMPSLYGFGLAYPGVTNMNGRLYKDVSIPSFLIQIKRCLQSLSL